MKFPHAAVHWLNSCYHLLAKSWIPLNPIILPLQTATQLTKVRSFFMLLSIFFCFFIVLVLSLATIAALTMLLPLGLFYFRIPHTHLSSYVQKNRLSLLSTFEHWGNELDKPSVLRFFKTSLQPVLHHCHKFPVAQLAIIYKRGKNNMPLC